MGGVSPPPTRHGETLKILVESSLINARDGDTLKTLVGMGHRPLGVSSFSKKLVVRMGLPRLVADPVKISPRTCGGIGRRAGFRFQ
jgi:hypothetical protein